MDVLVAIRSAGASNPGLQFAAAGEEASSQQSRSCGGRALCWALLEQASPVPWPVSLLSDGEVITVISEE